jgi:alcohol dehydrogenase class IV
MGCQVDGLGKLDAAKRSIEAVRNLARDVGIPDSLSGYGLREEHVRPVVDEAMKSGNVTVNPRRATSADLEQILRRVL